MGHSWTPEQIKAIQTPPADILVSAAAGSGKTAVLVERIITKICAPDGPDIDRLLVVTFTKAAASQMKEKICQAIEARLASSPGDHHLLRQMALLPRASIMTIDSFCLKLLREYYMLVDLDPSFQTADEKQCALIRAEALDEVMEQWYQKENNDGFLQLIEAFGEEKGDQKFRATLQQIYDFIQSTPFPQQWLDDAALRYAPCSWEDSFWAQAAVAVVEKKLPDLIAECALLFAQAEEEGILSYQPSLTEVKQALERLVEQGKHGYPSLSAAFRSFSFPTIGRKKKEEDAAFAEEIKSRYQQLKTRMKKLTETFFFASADSIQENLDRCADAAATISQIIKEFTAAYEKAKKEKLLVDYSDMEHYAIDILWEDTAEGKVPSPVAFALQEKFIEVMTDEYQDSNQVQESILLAVSGRHGAGKNRFMVGDVKQSIYGFRQAEPSLFLDKLARYQETGEELRIDLSKNFRSRPTVLGPINFIFSQLMDEALGGITYDDRAALQAAGTFLSVERPEQATVDVYLLDRKTEDTGDDTEDKQEAEELDSAKLEMRFVAKQILSLVESGYPVQGEDGTYRPVQFRDIVLLFRSTKNWSQAAKEALEQAGIPVYAPGGAKYYAKTEVSFVLSLLKTIDNSRQDIPLLAVLHSPVFGFTDSELLLIKLSCEGETFFDRLEAYGQREDKEELTQKVQAFLQKLYRWKEDRHTLPVRRLLWKLYDETGYYRYVGLVPPGNLRQANLMLLAEKAEQVEQAGQRGLFPFIRYVEETEKEKRDEDAAALFGEQDNLVRISTIHKSKGLEYPIVFLCGLGKKLNRQDLREDILLAHQGGIAFDAFDPDLRVKYVTLAKSVLKEKKREDNQAEELRVLYVALTRAKEKLILTGTVRDMASAATKWCTKSQQTVLPYLDRLEADTYLDLIGPALSRHPDGKELWEAAGKSAPSFFLPYTEESSFLLKMVKRNEVLAPMEPLVRTKTPHPLPKSSVLDRLFGHYAYPKATRLPANISISELKRHLQQIPEGDVAYYAPWTSFSLAPGPEGKLSAKEKGTAMHTLLEHLDFTRDCSEQELSCMADRLVQQHLLTREERASIALSKVMTFLHSALGQRMQRAKSLCREESFTISLTPQEIFGAENWTEGPEDVLLHGIIDCYFEEDDGLVFVDYKTNWTSDPTGMELAKQYQIQLSVYAKALQRITGKPVRQAYLYSFYLDLAIDCTALCQGGWQ